MFLMIHSVGKKKDLIMQLVFVWSNTFQQELFQSLVHSPIRIIYGNKNLVYGKNSPFSCNRHASSCFTRIQYIFLASVTGRSTTGKLTVICAYFFRVAINEKVVLCMIVV